MTAGERTDLTEAVLDVCDRYDRIGGPGVKSVTDFARTHLTDPLRIAVVGQVKAGKSTLVNAVLGRKVAATDIAECTRIVTHYRFGTTEHGEIHLSGGRIEPVTLRNGMLPPSFGWPIDQISHATISLPLRALRDFTLIDTPGQNTTTAENEVATRRHVLGVNGVRQADAIIYVFRDQQQRADVDFIREFNAAAGATSSSAAFGVLSHADMYGKGPSGAEDPLPKAAQRATELAAERTGELATIVPLAGRLAEASATGGVTEADARDLAALGPLSDVELAAEILPPSVSPGSYRRLVETIGEYGVRYGRPHAVGGAVSLVAWMDGVSGLARLTSALARQYVGRYPQLKAKQAIDQLERAVYGAPDPMALKRMISDARIGPRLHPLEELRAWEAMSAVHEQHPALTMLDTVLTAGSDGGRVGLPHERDPGRIRAAAVARAAECQRLGLGADTTITFAAQTLVKSFSIIAARNEA